MFSVPPLLRVDPFPPSPPLALGMRELEVRRLGVVPTPRHWPSSDSSSRSAVRTAIPDLLLLLQHPPVITLGVKGDGGRANIVATDERLAELGIEVSRPGAAATSPTTGPGRSSAIRSST